MSKILDNIIGDASLEEVNAMVDLATVCNIVALTEDMEYRHADNVQKIKEACRDISRELRTEKEA